jgi:hypothetical protein
MVAVLVVFSGNAPEISVNRTDRNIVSIRRAADSSCASGHLPATIGIIRSALPNSTRKRRVVGMVETPDAYAQKQGI